MEFTKQELEWLEHDIKNLRLGDMLEELNQRAQSYTGYQSWTVQQRQQQALTDFQNFIKPNEFVATTEETDHKNWIYFRRA